MQYGAVAFGIFELTDFELQSETCYDMLYKVYMRKFKIEVINHFDVLQHFSNDIMCFGGVNTYIPNSARQGRDIFVNVSPSHLPRNSQARRGFLKVLLRWIGVP